MTGDGWFQYDLWCDTVNTASRMETMGERGRVQVSQAIYDRRKDSFEFEVRCELDVKAKSRLRVWDPIGREARDPRQPGA